MPSSRPDVITDEELEDLRRRSPLHAELVEALIAQMGPLCRHPRCREYARTFTPSSLTDGTLNERMRGLVPGVWFRVAPGVADTIRARAGQLADEPLVPCAVAAGAIAPSDD